MRRFTLAHATGFCKEVLQPVVASLGVMLDGAEVRSFDHRNHGASGRLPGLNTWWPLGDDVLAVVDGDVGGIGIGHSCGGAALTYAELIRPGTFRALVLVEPIITPAGPPTFAERDLADSAQRRKPGYASKAEAYDNFASKPAFSGWQPEALRGYVDGGLRPHGSGWLLRCLPEDEAGFYLAASNQSGWDRLGEISCPVVIVHGEHSNSHPPAVVEALAAQFTGAVVTTTTVGDTTHFLPMERPEAVAASAVRLAA